VTYPIRHVDVRYPTRHTSDVRHMQRHVVDVIYPQRHVTVIDMQTHLDMSLRERHVLDVAFG
jgi:hypothetical protein